LDDAYFGSDINPLIYKDYPLSNSMAISNRDISILGLVPEKAMLIMPSYIAQASQGAITTWIKTRIPYLYDLPFAYKADFVELQTKAAQAYIYTLDAAKYNTLMSSTFPFMRYGNYKVRYEYILPDGTKTSTAMFDYYNSLKIR
jgi:hypothetical protein